VAYNSQITRADAQSLIPEDVQREIIKNVPQQSSVMQLGRRLPDMTRNQRRMPVLSSLVQAYFLESDTGMKQTSDQSWANKYMDAAELAVIVPIPEAVLDDVDYDIWSEIRPSITEAIGKAVDRAILFGENAPTQWPDDLLTGATAAGNSVSLAAAVDIYDAVLGTSGVLTAIEQDGYGVTGHVADLSMKGKLRGLRDSVGQPIFMTGLAGGPAGGGGDANMQGLTRYELDGSPLYFPMNGGFDSSSALMISGNWSQLVWAIRQDITFKFLDQSALFDNAGNLVFNLPQQDMVALRAVIRLAWQVPNPINRIQETEASRYPFGVLTA
jgi:HK97 family phage major capsid protein